MKPYRVNQPTQFQDPAGFTREERRLFLEQFCLSPVTDDECALLAQILLQEEVNIRVSNYTTASENPAPVTDPDPNVPPSTSPDEKTDDEEKPAAKSGTLVFISILTDRHQTLDYVRHKH